MNILLGILLILHPIIALALHIAAPIYLYWNGHYIWGSIIIATIIISGLTCRSEFRMRHIKTDNLIRLLLTFSPCLFADADTFWIITPALWVTSANAYRDTAGIGENTLAYQEAIKTYGIILGVILSYITIY